MQITNKIQSLIADALKANDEIRLSTLRMLSSAFNYERIAKMHDLSDDEELEVVKKEAKKRKDAIDALRQAQGKQTSSGSNMDEKIKKEEAELKILEEFLPQQMSDEEIEKIVAEAIAATGASDMKDMGKVIGFVMGKVDKSRVDGGRVSQIVKEKLIK